MILSSEFSDALDEFADKWSNKLYSNLDELKEAIDSLKSFADEANDDYVVIAQPAKKDAA